MQQPQAPKLQQAEGEQLQQPEGAPPNRPITPGNRSRAGAAGPGSQVPGLPRQDRTEQPINPVDDVTEAGPYPPDDGAPEEIKEYQEAFSTRAKLVRTPQESDSRGQQRR